MGTQENCENCVFCQSQECHRRAPTAKDDEGYCKPSWPVLYDPCQYWCGEWRCRYTGKKSVVFKND